MEREYYVREAKADIARLEAQVDVHGRLLDWTQECLWDNLRGALRMAVNGYWSMSAESAVRNIVWIARVRGVTDPGKVSIPLLASGVYHTVCTAHLDLKPKLDFDLDDYIENWGDYQQLMKAIPEIEKMEVEEFVEGLE